MTKKFYKSRGYDASGIVRERAVDLVLVALDLGLDLFTPDKTMWALHHFAVNSDANEFLRFFNVKTEDTGDNRGIVSPKYLESQTGGDQFCRKLPQEVVDLAETPYYLHLKETLRVKFMGNPGLLLGGDVNYDYNIGDEGSYHREWYPQLL